jgi:hypothetical protein
MVRVAPKAEGCPRRRPVWMAKAWVRVDVRAVRKAVLGAKGAHKAGRVVLRKVALKEVRRAWVPAGKAARAAHRWGLVAAVAVPLLAGAKVPTAPGPHRSGISPHAP